jgi:hypothetical protein
MVETIRRKGDSSPAVLCEGIVAVVADDDVVKNLNPEQLRRRKSLYLAAVGGP